MSQAVLQCRRACGQTAATGYCLPVIMAQLTIQQAFDVAGQHLQAGRLDQAQPIYRQIAAQQPSHAGALHALGVIALRRGEYGNAVELFRQAVQLAPQWPEAQRNLGTALKACGQVEQAIAAYRQALTLKPDFADAYYNLGNALKDQGALDEAIAAYRQALALQPNHAGACNNLGVALKDKGLMDQAIAAYRQAIAARPDFPEAHCNLGAAWQTLRQTDQAITAYRQAIAFRPNFPQAYDNLGVALQAKGLLDQAIAAYRQAIALQPGFPGAYNNLGNALKDKRHLDQAAAAYRQAIVLKPDFAEAHSNLGAALKENGHVDEGIAAYRQALALIPDFAEAHSNLGAALADKGQLDDAVAEYRRAVTLNPELCGAYSNLVYTLNFHPGYDAQAIYHEHRHWNQQYAEPLKKHIRPHNNDRNPDRRLRIGYVSPDFRSHPIGRFLLPLLANHDRQAVEVFAYSQVAAPDAMTHRLRDHTDGWRNLVGLADVPAAELIRQDGIDILVDLMLHMAHNRLLIFACKPAPVQVTYLAYAGTSGMTTMDYRLSDPYLDPPGMDESIYSEQTIRLAETYWCYQPVVDFALRPPPVLEKGLITFGCLNTFGKVNEALLDLWARILGAVPQARLLLHAQEGDHRQRALDHFQRQGIAPSRISFAGMANTAAYLARYQTIDIALDTHPYGGGTTTCDALWLGVPVVSLAGKTAVGRAGLSILVNMGLPELVADTPEDYVHLAVTLANDLPRLQELRSTLRQRMQSSPLMDAPRFARNIEAAYRQMWHKWCAA